MSDSELTCLEPALREFGVPLRLVIEGVKIQRVMLGGRSIFTADPTVTVERVQFGIDPVRRVVIQTTWVEERQQLELPLPEQA